MPSKKSPRQTHLRLLRVTISIRHGKKISTKLVAIFSRLSLASRRTLFPSMTKKLITAMKAPEGKSELPLTSSTDVNSLKDFLLEGNVSTISTDFFKSQRSFEIVSKTQYFSQS